MLKYCAKTSVQSLFKKTPICGYINGNYIKHNHCFSVVYREHGDPEKVLDGVSSPVPVDMLGLGLEPDDSQSLGSTDVAVRMMAAPINPADINMIQGVYPIKPPLPAVGGNEGVGEVTAVGNDVKNLSVGDWVVPGFSGWGTWRSHAVCTAGNLNRVSNDVSLATIATMGVTTCTAYRMLVDFGTLCPDDVVIQNAANSGVGQAVIQVAAHMGLRTINIVRKRDNIDELVDQLKSLGGTYVVTDEFVRTKEMKTLMNSLSKPKLALNCVGGKGVAELLKYLDKGSVMVTYGGMSKQPMVVPAGPLIFNDIKLRGYWMTEWNNIHNRDERQKMWDYLCDLVRKGNLNAPRYRTVPIKMFRDAVARSMEPYTTEKQILVMNSD